MVIRTALGLTLKAKWGDWEVSSWHIPASQRGWRSDLSSQWLGLLGQKRRSPLEMSSANSLCGDEFPKLQSPLWKQLLYQVFCLALSVEKMSIWVNRIFWLSSEHKNELIWWQNCVDCQVVFPIHKEYAGKIPITCSVCQEEANIATWTVDAVHKLKALDIFYNTSQWYESSTVQ